MRLGLGVLKIAPADFWAMTLTELLAAAGWSGREAMGRQRLTALMQAWPDGPG